MGQKYLKSVKRAIDILKYIGNNQKKGLTLKEIADKFEKTPSTILPILNTLVDEKIIENKNNFYKLSLGILELSFHVSTELNIKEISHKYLEEISKRLQGNSHLGVYSDGKVIYVDRVVNSPRGYIYTNIVGMVAYAYRTGLGKALLAFQSQEEIYKYISETTFEKRTPYTIVEKREFLENLNEVKKRGYSYDIQESNEGVSCIGIPIFSNDKIPVCAISISVPHSKFVDNKNFMLKEMLKAAKKISEEIRQLEGKSK
ncbi:MAG: IclR family transcriptional regulator, regulon repressor [Kosmotogales bacterium]|nr:IclR family transcriptional regulator, regulon repressor [Kosmotogales bacterium]